MNAVSTPDGGSPIAHDFSPEAAAVPPGDAALGLQLCRASIMSLMRLQLAFERCDRMGAMEAIDRLHALDAEVERIMADMPGGEGDPRRDAANRILREEKMAVAFEKLALASGIDGPALDSPPRFLGQGDGLPRDAAGLERDDDPPAGARLVTAVRTYGARAALLVAIGAGTVAVITLAL